MAAGCSLVDGQVERRPPTSAGLLQVHAVVLTTIASTGVALEIRVREQTAVAKTVRVGGQRHLLAAREQDATRANAAGQTVPSDKVTAERPSARPRRPEMLG